MWKVQDNNKNDERTIINYDEYRNYDLRCKSERGEYAPSFIKSVKPEKIYFNGQKMPVTGECRGLKRNKITFRAVWAWNKEFTNGSIESVQFGGASRKDKEALPVINDIIELCNSVVDLYIKEGEI